MHGNVNMVTNSKVNSDLNPLAMLTSSGIGLRVSGRALDSYSSVELTNELP